MVRVKLKMRISSINKVPEIVDCFKLYPFYSEYHDGIYAPDLMKYAECQEAQKLKMHKFLMSKVMVNLRRDASFF